MLWRLVIVLLVTAVSPVAATVCEVACASPAYHAHRAVPATPAAAPMHEHHHHHATSDTPPLPPQALVEIASSDCDPLDQLPARVRTVDYDAAAHCDPPLAWLFRSTTPVFAHHAPSARPPLSTVPIPLRI